MTRYFFAKHYFQQIYLRYFQPGLERSQPWETTRVAEILSHNHHSYNCLQVKICWKIYSLFHQGKCNVINILTSSLFYVLLALLGSELLEDYSIMRQCAIGGDQGPKKDWRFVDNQTGEQSILNKKQKAWKDDFFFPFRIQWSPLCLKSCQQLPQSQVSQ